MFEHGLSEQQVAWYLLMNTRIPNWEQAKQVAREMRNEYEENDNRNECGNEQIKERIKRAGTSDN